MDDYNSNVLNDSKNEWCIRLMNILCGHIIDGFRAIFNEALTLCESNDEVEKYLMTFQNLLAKIKNWNQITVENECERIKKASNCPYLEDLVTCVHIIQLKLLSCVRVTNKNQKIDIDIPDVNNFLHRVYVNISRKLYCNIYLFQIDVSPLEQQKNNREIELIVQSCIMNTIRDNIPIDQLLRQYIDETQEVDVETVEKVVEEPVKQITEYSQPSPPPVQHQHEMHTPTPSLPIEAPIEPQTSNVLSVDVNQNDPDKLVPQEPSLNVSFSEVDDIKEMTDLENQFEKETKLNIEDDGLKPINLDFDVIDEPKILSSDSGLEKTIDIGAEVLEL